MAEPLRADLPPEVQHLREWIGQGIERMETIPDERTRDEVFALLDGIDLLHRQCLSRLIQQVETLGGTGLLERVVADPVVRSLLDLYGLLQDDERAAEQALEPVVGYIESHGGQLQLLSVEDGRVRVRLSGSCQGCAGSANTLKRVVEEALRADFPGFRELIEDTPPPAARRVQIQLQPAILRRPRWVSVGSLSDLARGQMTPAWPEGRAVLLVRIEGEVYAHHNACPPGSALVLHTGQLDGTTLTCPWHGCRYDVRTGKRLDAEGKLGVLPVAVENGEVKIALGVEEVAVR